MVGPGEGQSSGGTGGVGAPWWARSGRASREAPFCEQSSALTSASFDVLRSAVFFYIKSPLRVEEAGLQELIPTTWWPHSGREVGGPRGVAGSVRARPGCPSPPHTHTAEGPLPQPRPCAGGWQAGPVLDEPRCLSSLPPPRAKTVRRRRTRPRSSGSGGAPTSGAARG